MFSREWGCSWSSTDRRCSSYIWVINNFIAYKGVTYIRGLIVMKNAPLKFFNVLFVRWVTWPLHLTHWGRVTHICVGKLTIIGSDDGLSPGRRQAIIWTNAGLLLNRHLGTNFSEILIGIQIFSFKKMHLKMSSAKWRPFCLGLNVLSCPHVAIR